jgi:hypothetical protein
MGLNDLQNELKQHDPGSEALAIKGVKKVGFVRCSDSLAHVIYFAPSIKRVNEWVNE